MILEAAESVERRVVFISITEFLLIAPEKTSEPQEISTGTDSPVMAELSTKDVPIEVIPSTRISSPVFTIIV